MDPRILNIQEGGSGHSDMPCWLGSWKAGPSLAREVERPPRLGRSVPGGAVDYVSPLKLSDLGSGLLVHMIFE